MVSNPFAIRFRRCTRGLLSPGAGICQSTFDEDDDWEEWNDPRAWDDLIGDETFDPEPFDDEAYDDFDFDDASDDLADRTAEFWDDRDEG
jgi:hypothetical protein